MSTPSSGGSFISTRRAGTSSLARHPPPPSPSSAGSYTARGGGLSRPSRSPAATPSSQESAIVRRATGAPRKTSSGATRPTRAHPSSPKAGSSARSSAEGAAKRTSSRMSPPKTVPGGDRKILKRSLEGEPAVKSSEATRHRLLSMRRDKTKTTSSRGAQSTREVPPTAKSTASSPVESTSSTGPSVTTKPAAATSNSGEKISKEKRGVTLHRSPPVTTATSPPTARAPSISSNIRVTVPAEILRHYVPTTSLPATVTTTTVTTTTCGSPIMATGLPAGRRSTPSPPAARRRSPSVVDQRAGSSGVWTPAPAEGGFSAVIGEGAWVSRQKTPPPSPERQQSTPPAEQNSGGFEVQGGGAWSVSRGRRAGRRAATPPAVSPHISPAASGSRAARTPPPVTAANYPPLPLSGGDRSSNRYSILEEALSEPAGRSDERRDADAVGRQRRRRRTRSPSISSATRGRVARAASGSPRGDARDDVRSPRRPVVNASPQPSPEAPAPRPANGERPRGRARFAERDALVGRAADVATVADLEIFAARVAEFFRKEATGPGDRRDDIADRPVRAGSERPRRGAGPANGRDGDNREGRNRQGNQGERRADWVREATRIQALYRANRRKAVREVLHGPPEFCRVQKDRVHEYFTELYRGGLALDGAGAVEPDQPLCEGELAALADPFTVREVERRLRRVSNSAPGPDGVTYKDLRDADPGCRLLTAIFNICLRLEVVPASWKNSNTVLVYKKGDQNDLENWRPLAMGDTTPKLFAAVVADRLTDWAIARRKLSPAQKGFLRDEGCYEHNFVLQEILTDARRSRRQVVVAWLDLSNAFGSVPHATIRRALTRAGVPGCLINIWASMYEGCTTRVRTADGWTAPIPIRSGVKQGCPLSPIVFNFAVDSVLRAATAVNAGYNILGQRWSALAYADDIALVADTPDGMRRLLTVVETEARSVGLRFNPAKCATMHIRAGTVDRVLPTSFEIQGERVHCLAEGESYRHLGIPTGFSVDQNPYSTIQSMMEDLQRVERSLLTPWQRVEMVATYILPRLDFLLRGAKVEKGLLKVADKQIRRLAKSWLNLPQRASAEVVYIPPSKGGCGLLPLADLVDVLTMAHVFRVLTADDAGVRDLAWASLRGVVQRRIRAVPTEHDIASFLSGSLERRFRDGGERSLWSDARNASRRQSSRLRIRWSWVEETRELLLECRGSGNNLVKIPPDARAQVIHTLRSAVASYYTSTLLAKPDQGKVHEVAMRHGVSNHFMRTGSFTRFADWRFLHRARLDVLPLNGARRWGEGGDTRCRRCGGNAETLPHVINHCGVHADAIQLRHDDLLLRLAGASRLPGEVRINQRVEGVDEEFADLRPDLVIRHEPSKSIIIVDVTVPFENRREAFDEAGARKITKYSPLAEALTREGYRVVVTPFVVGSLGSWDRRNESVLKLLRVSNKYAAMMRRLMVSDTIRWSRDIYVEHVSGLRQYAAPARSPGGTLRANTRAIRRRYGEREMAILAHRGRQV